LEHEREPGIVHWTEDFGNNSPTEDFGNLRRIPSAWLLSACVECLEVSGQVARYGWLHRC
jgi:hypothetical protein